MLTIYGELEDDAIEDLSTDQRRYQSHRMVPLKTTNGMHLEMLVVLTGGLLSANTLVRHSEVQWEVYGRYTFLMQLGSAVMVSGAVGVFHSV